MGLPPRKRRAATRSARGRPEPPPRVVRFEMPSRREAVTGAVERVLQVVGEDHLDPDQRDDLAVAVGEALSNAAVHGNRLHSRTPVRVAIELGPRRVVVEIEDAGRGFDRSSLADPTRPDRILLPSGRGVFLMGRLVDNLEYNQAGNHVRLTIKRRRRRPRART